MEWLRAGASRRESEQFVAERTGPLPHTAYLMAGNLAEAEDLVQETMLQVAGNWPRVRAMQYPAASSHRAALLGRPARSRSGRDSRLLGRHPQCTGSMVSLVRLECPPKGNPRCPCRFRCRIPLAMLFCLFRK
jgi:hypothetical protein